MNLTSRDRPQILQVRNYYYPSLEEKKLGLQELIICQGQRSSEVAEGALSPGTQSMKLMLFNHGALLVIAQ